MAMQRGKPAFSSGLGSIFAAAVSMLLAAPAAGQSYKVLTAVPDKMTGGTTAFIDAINGKRIVEIDEVGKVVWLCSLAAAHFKSGELRRGADLEWIKADDTFLVTIPMSGIFRIDRNCKVIWQYRTAKVSHDADLLPNGNVLYTFAWDTQSDWQAVEIDPSGKVVWRWQARGKVDPAWSAEAAEREGGRARGKGGGGKGGGGQGGGDRESDFTHANAVVRLPDGDTLVSLRNFHRVVRVAPDGSVRRSWGPIHHVHEPMLLPDGSLLAAQRAPMIVAIYGKGPRKVVFSNEIGITPIRTVEQLARGNFLLTGGEDIVEIDGEGTVVWHVKIFSGLGARIRDGVYKAVRVAK